MLEEQKEELIKEIEEKCLDHNFGSLSKADFDLILFHHYMESIRRSGNSMTNYEIAKQLGITVQRVIGLKDKEAGRYPYDDNTWKTQFLKCFESSYVEGNMIVLNIPDRRIYRELESFMEKQGLGAEYNLNPTILKAQPDLFIDVIKKLYPNNEEVLEALDKKAKEKNSIDENDKKTTTAKSIGKYVVDFAADVLASVISQKITLNM